jgi:hypothetical protein
MKSYTKETVLTLDEKVKLKVKFTFYPAEEMDDTDRYIIEDMELVDSKLIDLFNWLNDKMEVEVGRASSHKFMSWDNLYEIIEIEIYHSEN